jgi:hypothetical protein
MKTSLTLPRRIFSPYEIKPAAAGKFSWQDSLELLWIREELSTAPGKQPRTIGELSNAQNGWQILRITGAGAIRYFRSMQDFCHATFNFPVMPGLLDLQNWKVELVEDGVTYEAPLSNFWITNSTKEPPEVVFEDLSWPAQLQLAKASMTETAPSYELLRLIETRNLLPKDLVSVQPIQLEKELGITITKEKLAYVTRLLGVKRERPRRQSSRPPHSPTAEEEIPSSNSSEEVQPAAPIQPATPTQTLAEPKGGQGKKKKSGKDKHKSKRRKEKKGGDKKKKRSKKSSKSKDKESPRDSRRKKAKRRKSEEKRTRSRSPKRPKSK